MTTKEFIQYASERPELCEKMSACTAPEEGYAIAKEAGLTDDKDTFVKVMTEIKEGTIELNEADLDNITAAANTDIITYTIGVSGSVVGFFASMAV